ncbi:MAG: TRAP transporter large permease [Eubacteriales bacterium]|jgi:tripartite ATP-independent transporter DctM subunit|nr:TRAP transporter large permease [Eubacteriales bacterium]
MSSQMLGLISIVLLLVLIFSRVWVSMSMALVGFLGLVYMDGLGKALTVVGTEPISAISDYSYITIPLFIFMGTIVSNTGLGEDLYRAARMWVGQVRGGLAIASVAVSGVFAAISGSSTASVATLGTVAYPEMVKEKYDSRLASGCIAAGGTIGILIPPSIGFIIYGLLTENSIGKLFIAGIIPGILQVVFYMVTIFVICVIKPDWGPTAPKVEATLGQKLSAAKNTWPVVILVIVILGGIYTGVFTPNEAAAVGAFGAIVLSFMGRRLTWNNLVESVGQTVQNTAMIMLMMAGAYIFMRYLAVSRLPAVISAYIVDLHLSKATLMLSIAVFYLITGCFLDVYAAMILTLPIVYPIVIGAGFDPIWFGVIMVRLLEVGIITPPFGLNCFVFNKIAGVPLKTVFTGIAPFLVADFFHLLLLMLVPSLSLYLVK